MAKHKKQYTDCKINEDDVALILDRYSVTAILGLLREVAQYVGSGNEKIDWDALVKRTATGISNSREYQMLWRHLAYRQSLFDTLPTETQPLDDDSDLECEVEAFPETSNEVSSEAAAFVKVLMSSGLENDPGCINGSMVEAPLTINIPCNYVSAPSEGLDSQGLNISVPVFLQKQPLSGTAATSMDHIEVSCSADARHKKRRKHWTKDEDRELTEAVKQFGVGNWATIVKGDYKWDRTATQLSQRWAHLRRKKPGVYSLGRDNSNNLSEVHQAARHAMNLALDPPSKNSIISHSGLNSVNNNPGSTSVSATDCSSSISNKISLKADAIPPSNLQPSSVSKPAAASTPSTVAAPHTVVEKTEAAASGRTDHVVHQQTVLTKPQLNLDRSKGVSAMSDLSSDPVRAAAVAAGARIATRSDAASLIKAAQAKNAVHIIATGSVKPPPQPALVPCSSASSTGNSKSSAMDEGKTLEGTRNQSADVLDSQPGKPLNPANSLKQSVGNSCSTTSAGSAKLEAVEVVDLLKVNGNGSETCKGMQSGNTNGIKP